MAKNIHVAPGDVKQGMDFITVSILPRYYKQKARQQFLKTIDHIHKLIQTVSTEYAWVAELTQQGNIHYHIVSMANQEYANDIIMDTIKGHKKLGNTFINKSKVTDTLRTYNYLIKDVPKTHRMVNYNNDPKVDPTNTAVNGVWKRPMVATIASKRSLLKNILSLDPEQSESDTLDWCIQANTKLNKIN